MPKLPIVLGAALALVGCGELTPEEQARLDAQLACSAKLEAEYPVVKEISAVDDEDSTDDFQVQPNGTFVWIARAKGKNRPLSDNVECRGNVNKRTIESVELNGVTKRPPEMAVWTY